MKPGESQSKAGPLESAPASADFKTRLIEGSPDCIKVLDLDGRLLSMNAGGMAVLEICDLKPFIGSAWVDFWQGEDHKAAQAAVKAARNGGMGRFVGFFPTAQTRKPMWFDVVISPINDANGKPEKLLAASRDVTQWKRAENLLHAIVDGTSVPSCKDSGADSVCAMRSSRNVSRIIAHGRWRSGTTTRSPTILNTTSAARLA